MKEIRQIKEPKNTTQLSFDEVLLESNVIDKTKNEEAITESMATSGDTYPISLVNDFILFLDYFHHHSVSLTKMNEYISRKHLQSINELLSIKNKNATSYAVQEFYPYIHFFYFLAFSGGLLEKAHGKAGKLQIKETDRLRLFKEFTDIEKYFFLLETFWVDVNWGRLLDTRFYELAMDMQEILSTISATQHIRPILLGDNENAAKTGLGRLFYKLNYFPLYLEWFGFWKCQANQVKIDSYFRKNHYFAKSITLTNFGAKMIPILLIERNLNLWNIALRRETGEINPIPGSKLEDMMFGDIPPGLVNALYDRMKLDQSAQSFFQPFVALFPNEKLKRALPRDTRKFIDGIYTFKVYFSNSVWRKIVTSGKHTMDDLHGMILKAFDFDEDHLYSFFMDGIKWSDDCIVSPYDDYVHPNADKVKIGEVGFSLKQRFLYLYDYGDEWTFVVEVDHIEEIDSVPFQPYVKEGNGESPDQYDYYYED